MSDFCVFESQFFVQIFLEIALLEVVFVVDRFYVCLVDQGVEGAFTIALLFYLRLQDFLFNLHFSCFFNDTDIGRNKCTYLVDLWFECVILECLLLGFGKFSFLVLQFLVAHSFCFFRCRFHLSSGVTCYNNLRGQVYFRFETTELSFRVRRL